MQQKSTSKTRMSSEERRTCIVETACRIFAEKGFRGTTTRELAAAVGVTEPVLYEHFKTKRDLYAAIIESKAKQGEEAIAAMSDRYIATEDDEGFFVELGELILHSYMGDPTFARLLLFSNLEGHELKELFHERGIKCFGLVARHIALRIESGAMRKVDPAMASRVFFGMIAHYGLSGIVFGFSPFPKSPKEVVREMVDIFLGGMCKQENS